MLSRTLALASAGLAGRVSVGCIEVAFHVVGGDAEGFGAGEPGAEQQGEPRGQWSGRGVHANSWRA